MLRPSIDKNENLRIKDLTNLRILDTASEERFDRIVRITRYIFKVPIVAISLVDVNRQWFKSHCGLNVSETSRDISFCGHAIHHKKPMVVNDALLDNRFSDNPLVTQEPNIRFYAGMPFSSLNGYNLGTLCIIDTIPRDLTEEQVQILQDLSSWVELEMNAAILKEGFQRSKEQIEALEKMTSVMVDRELKMIQLKEELSKMKQNQSSKSILT